jgi:enoyl-CoA hydratase/carnithine racemase
MTAETRTRAPGHVALHIDGRIAHLVLTRADKLNALTVSTLHALDAACAEIEASPTVRAVIVRSDHPKAFCAGADIAEWGALAPVDMWRQFNRLGHRVFDRLARLPQPTIAAIEGVALGGGLELALACDLRIAGADARLGLPETTIGAVPGWGGTLRLPALVGTAQAKRLVLTGTPVDAAEALRIGLVQECVPAGDSVAHAQQLAARIASNAPSAVRLAKQLIDGHGGGVPAETIAAGFAAMLADGQEGVRAFREKRSPVYLDA